MRKFRSLGNGIWRIVSGQREISLSFATLTIADAVWALFLALTRSLGLPLFPRAREKFLARVQEKIPFQSAYLFASARSGLYIYLRTLGLEPGSQVLMTGYTCDVVANAVLQAGLRPVFVDIDPKSYAMSSQALRNAITPQSRVLIVQHSFGIPADLASLLAIASEAGLIVIEDCAVSLGVEAAGRWTGSFGDAAIFSFELTKPIISGRGGLLAVNRDVRGVMGKLERAYRDVPEQPYGYALQLLFQLGMSAILTHPRVYALGKYSASLFYRLGVFRQSTSPEESRAGRPADTYLLKLSREQALLLLRQWKRLPQILAHRKNAVSFYAAELGSPGCPDCDAPLIRYPMRVNGGGRDVLVEKARLSGIELGVWFSAPLSAPEVDHALFGYRWGSCPEAEAAAREIINLPTHPRVTAEDQRRIIRFLRENAVSAKG